MILLASGTITMGRRRWCVVISCIAVVAAAAAAAAATVAVTMMGWRDP